MFAKQRFHKEDDKYILRNMIDHKPAIELVKEENKDGGSKGKTIRCIGHIPSGLWLCDPWLIAAKCAMQEGNKYEHIKHINKFFELNPQYKLESSKRIWAGGF